MTFKTTITVYNWNDFWQIGKNYTRQTDSQAKAISLNRHFSNTRKITNPKWQAECQAKKIHIWRNLFMNCNYMERWHRIVRKFVKNPFNLKFNQVRLPAIFPRLTRSQKNSNNLNRWLFYMILCITPRRPILRPSPPHPPPSLKIYSWTCLHSLTSFSLNDFFLI